MTRPLPIWDLLALLSLLPTLGIMTNRKLAYIVKDQKPLMLALDETVQLACRCMRERGAGSVLVIDEQQRLRGHL